MSPAERLAAERGAPRGDRDGKRLTPMLCGRDETRGGILGQDGWLFELKLDGVRIVADKRNERVALAYRKGRDATASYPEVRDAIARLAEARVVLDGEVVAFDAEGKPDFQRLGTRIQTSGERAAHAARRVPVVYVVFDVLVVGERDVTGLPIEDRKAVLELILAESSKAGAHVRLHPALSDGVALFRFCREHRLEGVVAKRAGSPYRTDSRGADWIKVKCELEADFVVIGWTQGEGGRSTFGALDLGAYDGDRLVVCGSVGSGLGDEIIAALGARLRELEVAEPVATGTYPRKRGRHHVRPELVVSVRYAAITADGRLRHPVFRGLRPDISPEECTTGALQHGFVRDPGAR